MVLAVNQLKSPDYIVLAGYFALMLGIGIYFYRHMKGMKDYFSGGNSIPWWLSSVSFYMSSFSAFAFVGHAALAYRYGLVALTLLWTSIPATLISVIFFSRNWRRARIDSPVEYLELRYSPVVRQMFAWEGIPVRIIDDALKLVAIGIFVSKGLGLDMGLCMLGSGVIILGYTLMGGLWAVAVTDFVQFVVLAVAIVVLIPLSISQAGGINNAFSNFPDGFLHLTHPPKYDIVYIMGCLLVMTLAYSSINWSLIQRYYCVPKEKDALKVGWFVIILFIFGHAMVTIPPILAQKFIDTQGDDRQVYILLCLKLLPAGMVGLLIAAMFAATMSMLSSDFNICAGVLTNDVYRRLIRPQASQKELILAGRILTLLVGGITLSVAFLMIKWSGEKLFRGMVTLFSTFTPPVAVPMILGLFSRKMNNKGTLAGFLAGVGLGLTLFFLLRDQENIGGIILKKETILVLATTLITTVVMVTVSLKFPASLSESQRAECFLRRLNIPIGQLAEDKLTSVESGTSLISPFRVVGISILLIGVLMLVILPFVTRSMAFWLDLSIGLGLVLLGGLVIIRGRNSNPYQQPTEAESE